MNSLADQFGQIDIYLFDQMLRGRIAPGMRIFDAGCGYGRNLLYLMRQGYAIAGVDASADAVEAVRRMAHKLGCNADVRVAGLESMPFPEASADVVISSAVLHFAADAAQFQAMLHGTWSVLAAGGVFFCRLASSIGIESQIDWHGPGRYRLPDGSDRFLVDEAMLLRLTGELGGSLLDPIKTTVVQGQRAMTTWVVRKH